MAETRITAGEWRGRVIDTPRGLRVRPTRSLLRQALFNILAGRVQGATVCDLYAGAGTVGFEALSRGAAFVTFVDQDRSSLASIASTAERFSCRERCRLVRADSVAWARRGPDALTGADICFADAPYRDPDMDRLLDAVGASPPRLLVCEHHRRRHVPERVGGLALVRQVQHGLGTLSFWQRSIDDGGGSDR